MKNIKIRKILFWALITACFFSVCGANIVLSQTCGESFTISGRISDEDGNGIRGVVLDFPEPVTTDDSGFYKAEICRGWSGTVMPKLETYEFDAAVYNDVQENQTDRDYEARPAVYTISGYVLDHEGKGLEGVALKGFPEETVMTDSSGFYSGEVPFCWSGEIVPELTGFTFAPAGAAYTCLRRDFSYDYVGGMLANIDCGAATIQSRTDGNWNDPDTWTPARIPKWNDIVRIHPGHAVTVNSSANFKIKGLCNSGTLTTAPGTVFDLSADEFIYNQGIIQGSSASNGISGGSLILTAGESFCNTRSGTIQGGHGGDHFASTARGGDGGSIEIYGNMIINEGLVQGGDGGNAATPKGDGCAGSFGGDGGNAFLLADILLINTRNGTISTGSGGSEAHGHCSGYPGKGGDLVFSAPTVIQKGIVRVDGKGGSFDLDPTLAVTGPYAKWYADFIKIYGGKNWKLDLRNLSADAIVGGQKIIFAVGEGSLIDLRGVEKGAIRAPRVEVYGDNILLDDNVSLSDIIITPDLILGPPKIIYEFFMKVQKYAGGTAGKFVPIELFILNNSPEEDRYRVKVTDNRGRELNVLHYTHDLTVSALKKRTSFMRVLLPDTMGASDLLTVSLTSLGDPLLSKTAKVRILSTSPLPGEEPKDSDDDGLPDVMEIEFTDPQNADTDADGMKDGWELCHDLDPLYDDASEDADADGYFNLEEYEAATNPDDPNSVFISEKPLIILGADINAEAEGYIGECTEATEEHERFLNFLEEDVNTENFEGFDPEDAGPWAMDFGAVLSGDARIADAGNGDTNPDGCFPISGNQYLHVAPDNNTEAPAFTLTFDEPRAAFGFFALNFQDDTPLTLTFETAAGDENTVDVFNRSDPSGSVLFSGVIDTENPFVSVSFECDVEGEEWETRKGFAFDNFVIATKEQLKLLPTFEKGIFIAGDDGVVEMDWLYDGGGYQGELGIFSLSGMEFLEGEVFVREAVTRAMSNSRKGYIVYSDPREGARFRGILGEDTEWNNGPYRGKKRFEMLPRDRFAFIMIPNSTFEKFSHDPSTEAPYKRPLFSIISPNWDYGMHQGQTADVSGMGSAFVFEDIEFSESDKDYNDLIIQVFGASAKGIPSLDSLVSRKRGGTRRNSDDWFDWRTETEMGREIMEHIETASSSYGDLKISVILNASSDLSVYDSQGRECGEKGCHIPGAALGVDRDSRYRFVTLPASAEGEYRVVARSATGSTGYLSVRKHRKKGGIVSEKGEMISIGAHGTLVSDVQIHASGGDMSIDMSAVEESPAGPHDFNGDGIVDDADIKMLSSIWNTCEGDEDFDVFFDLDNDGCITILDITPVVNSSSAQENL